MEVLKFASQLYKLVRIQSRCYVASNWFSEQNNPFETALKPEITESHGEINRLCSILSWKIRSHTAKTCGILINLMKSFTIGDRWLSEQCETPPCFHETEEKEEETFTNVTLIPTDVISKLFQATNGFCRLTILYNYPPKKFNNFWTLAAVCLMAVSEHVKIWFWFAFWFAYNKSGSVMRL